MTIFAGCCPQIGSLTLDEFRETFDEVCDHIPFVSTISNVICVVQKHLYIAEMKDNGTFLDSRYYIRLENKDFERYWSLFIPFFNIMTAIEFSSELASNPVIKYSEDGEQRMLDKLFIETTNLPLVTCSKRQKITKNILKLSDFNNVPDEIMHVIYDKFQLTALIAFSRTCMQSWNSVNDYKKLLPTKINWLSRLQLLESNNYARKAYSFCLSSSLGSPNLSVHLKENIPSNEVLFDHLLLKPKMRLHTELNALELEKFNRDCHIFFFEHGTDEQLFSHIEKEIHQLQGLDLPNFNIQLMNVKWLETFGDSFFPLLTKERLARFYPLLDEKEEFGILPLLLNAMDLYIDKKIKKCEVDESYMSKESSSTRQQYTFYLIVERDGCLEEVENLGFGSEQMLWKEKFLELSKLTVKERKEECQNQISRLQKELDNVAKKREEIEDQQRTFFKLGKGISRCLYEENPNSMLWSSKEIRKSTHRYIEVASFMFFLNKYIRIDSINDENTLCLPKQFEDMFSVSTFDEKIYNVEEILLEIIHSKDVDDESVTEKKLDAFVRVLLVQDSGSVAELLFASDNLRGNVNFDSLIVRAIFRCVLVKADKRMLEFALRYLNGRQVDAFIDYCLELPMDLQAIHFSALLFYNFSNDWWNEQIYKERQLNPDDYPPLPPEAYYEAFFTRKL